jgi:hypothetical protein
LFNPRIISDYAKSLARQFLRLEIEKICGTTREINVVESSAPEKSKALGNFS